MKNIALLLMGGTGSRFKYNIPKQYIDINNVPLFIHTIKTFYDISSIDYIYMVIDMNYKEYINNQLIKYNFNLNRFIYVQNGANRMVSTLNGLEKIHNNFNQNVKVISHDIARCFIDKEIIEKHLETKINKNYMINTILPLNDSIIKINKNNSYKTINRKDIFIVQTPQTFLVNDFYFVLKQNFKRSNLFTDLCSFGLKFGFKIKNVTGKISNLKITYKDDLDIINIMKSI